MKILVLCILTVTAVLLFIDLPQRSLFWSSLQNAGHTLVFTLLTLIFLGQMSAFNAESKFAQYRSGLFLVILFGIVIELIQGLIGRDASASDLLRNFVGILIGWMLIWGYKTARRDKFQGLAIICLALIIFTLSFAGPIKYAISNWFQSPLPVIANFDYFGAGNKISKRGGAQLAIVRRSPHWPGNQSRALKVKFRAKRVSGVSLMEPHRDWSNFEYFEFQSYNPGQTEAKVTLRIHDFHHNNLPNDRFRRRLTLIPGEQKIAIPLKEIMNLEGHKSPKRTLDMTQIKGIIIFSSSRSGEKVLLFDNFQLR